jgi:hypothetical protein
MGRAALVVVSSGRYLAPRVHAYSTSRLRSAVLAHENRTPAIGRVVAARLRDARSPQGHAGHRSGELGHGIWFNDHVEGDGSTVFHHACNLGLEGIVSKRKDSPYRSGRSPDWLKMKNAAHPAVKREEEEDWGR